MVGIFEVETIESKWVPPFDKKILSNIYYVKENDLFDVEEHINEDVFGVESLNSDVAIIKFDRRFIVKKGIYSSNMDMVGPQTIKLHLGKPIELSFMWGSFGITKKITYQGIGKDQNSDKSE